MINKQQKGFENVELSSILPVDGYTLGWDKEKCAFFEGKRQNVNKILKEKASGKINFIDNDCKFVFKSEEADTIQLFNESEGDKKRVIARVGAAHECNNSFIPRGRVE